uniref:hypothetical protein n=1 Tax=Castellaniella defragrans TaxID=75697 RepID=UPI00333E6FFC
MTQEAVQITTEPPLPGLKLVKGLNGALKTLGTDFAGADDPAAIAWPYSTWADTGTGTIKRRNAAGSAWVVEGRLLRGHLPMYAQDDVPTSDIGPIYIIGKGAAEWAASKYEVLAPYSLWTGMPIGMEFPIAPGAPEPPTDSPNFRYIKLSAGLTGAGGYNAGCLGAEIVTGLDPTVTATAVVSLESSPMNGVTVALLNTTRTFLRPAQASGLDIYNSQNANHSHTGSTGNDGEHTHQLNLTVGSSGNGNGLMVGNPQSSEGPTGRGSVGYGGAHQHQIYIANSGGAESVPRHTSRAYYMRIK